MVVSDQLERRKKSMSEEHKLPKIIVPMGKTSSGKDTIAKFILEKFQIQPIVSYATRPMRDNEYDGVQHWFVDDAKMNELMADKSNLLAYANFPNTGYRYCASVQGLPNSAYVYILNPNAYLQMIKYHPDIETLVIFCDLPERDIIKRAKLRGDKHREIKERLKSERDEFNQFKTEHFTDEVYSGPKGITVNGVDLSNQKLYMISTLNSRIDVNNQVSEIIKDTGFTMQEVDEIVKCRSY